MTTDLAITAGLPFARRVRIIDGKNVWPTVGLFEARSQIRAGSSPTSALRFDLTPFLATSYDVNDILIDLVLTGAQTLNVIGGRYDLIVSDVGIEDARAIRALVGTVTVRTLTTSSA